MRQSPAPTQWQNADGTPSRPFKATGTVDSWPVPQLVHTTSERLARRESPPSAAARERGRETPSDKVPKPKTR